MSYVNEIVNDLIDTAVAETRNAEPNRDYLGASAIGEECERKIQYQQRHGSTFPGRVYRIFERGHWVEDACVEWMRQAGFVLKTKKKDGKQFGFEIGSPSGKKYKGHSDGVIVEVPKILRGVIKTPAGWECKGVNDDGYEKFMEHGLKSAYPAYYDQVSQYATYLDLTNQYVVFVINMNDMRIGVELIEFDAGRAQYVSDKAVRIIEAETHGELLPRAFPNPDFYKCRAGWCEFREKCWEGQI